MEENVKTLEINFKFSIVKSNFNKMQSLVGRRESVVKCSPIPRPFQHQVSDTSVTPRRKWVLGHLRAS